MYKLERSGKPSPIKSKDAPRGVNNMGIQGWDLPGRLSKAVMHVNNRIALDGNTELLAWFPGERNRSETGMGRLFSVHTLFLLLCIFSHTHT